MRKLWVGLCAGIWMVSGSTWAEEAPKKPWKNAAELSVVSTNGNSKTNTTSAKNVFSYNWTKVGLEIAAGGLGSSSGGEVTAEQYFANEKVQLKFAEKDYVYEKFGWDKNRFAGIQNRWDASAGLGRMVLDRPKDKLNAELGGGYVNEERTDAPRNDFASGRAYAKYIHAFTETAHFSQDGEYLHNFKDEKDYRLNTETALTAGLSAHLSLKTSFIWNRLGRPAPGVVKDDTKVMVGLIVNY